MKQFIRLFWILTVFNGVLFLAGCATSGTGYSSGSVSYGVYGGYGYPYYRYGYGGCCYDDIDRPNQERRQERRENRPDRPTTQNLANQSGRMGRPSNMQMSRPARMPRRRGP